jgi:DNA-binding NtrC family response regulator
MKEGVKALLVQSRSDPLGTLRSALEEQSIDLRIASNCAEAALVLWSHTPPHIVFTEVQLADGNWADVLTLAAKASAPVNVIVAARFVDVPFYVQAIERGAFDFIVPPLSEPELLHVVRVAVQNSLSRRLRQAGVLPTGPVTAASQLGSL